VGIEQRGIVVGAAKPLWRCFFLLLFLLEFVEKAEGGGREWTSPLGIRSGSVSSRGGGSAVNGTLGGVDLVTVNGRNDA